MKTAVFIPDPLFEEVEVLTKRLGLSRSKLYGKALADFVSTHSEDNITELLNAVYSKESSSLDPKLARAQYKSLRRDPW